MSTRLADEQYMQRALRLAHRGLGRVEPNPMVGCVLVRRGQIIGEGWHRRFGGPHAEVDALAHCDGSARGATAYVTLEPCCYVGKTPACTEALIAAGVARVVAATYDPNPKVSGKGLRMLRAAGIATEVGLLGSAAERLIAPFAKLMTERRPWVIAKWAQSLDGCIATRTGDSKWISDAACREHAHRTRGRVDAIVVGVNTVIADDPQLTCRAGRPARRAVRVVVDSNLRCPLQSIVVSGARHTPTWIACAQGARERRRRQLEAAGCCVIALPSRDGRVSLAALLEHFGRVPFANVLFEGGGELLGALLDGRLADELHAYVAPRLIGGRGAIHALNSVGPERVAHGAALSVEAIRRMGDGWFIQARPRYATKARSRRAATRA